jgi:hypothetical protein
MQTVHLRSPGEPPFGPLQIGDTVVVQKRDGEQACFIVQRIEGQTLIASTGHRYVRSELVRIERKAYDRPRTIGLIAGIAGGVFVVVAITVGVWLGENSR